MVSIIICARNHLHDLSLPCLASIKRNTVAKYEVILVDDASDDGTFQAFKRLTPKAFRLDTNSGPGVARNVGLGAAYGDFICFLDNDILVPRYWLSTLLREHQKRAPAIMGGIPSDEAENRLRMPRTADGLIERLEIATACMLVPRIVFNTIGFFDEKLSFTGEDTDFCFRAKLAGFGVFLTPKLVVRHKAHGTLGNITLSDRKRQSLEHFRYKWLNATGRDVNTQMMIEQFRGTMGIRRIS